MRVSLPVYPRDKTRGEVTTLRWVQNNTHVPVPNVIGFDDDNDNEIGFEWILMEFVEGTSAYTKWRTMSMEQKITLTKQVADFQAEFLGCGRLGSPFETIGTLQIEEKSHEEESVQSSTIIRPGQLVSHPFFMGDHLHYNVPRGPFRSTHDWLSAQLSIILIEQAENLKKAEDEDDQEDAEDRLSVAQKLLNLLPTVFPPKEEGSEPTCLCHSDLHLNNIFVDENGTITAVLDWECASALPLWYATMVPKFLEGGAREEEPQRDGYADESPDDKGQERNDTDSLDNEGKNQLYWIHRMEYEKTQLRKVYEARLKELWSEKLFEESLAKVEFFETVLQCDGIWVKKAGRWVDRTEKGEVIRFIDA
ncbi:kinase-like protein [Periconia macrospinosa]|uniref:Kinase-like protein n=1 Tax=Periconia macrospinosa TaxID=97972 RepID=A0A2V1E081_9PLEO|nr:kinase-like protein [Periconia macrospinosa]